MRDGTAQSPNSVTPKQDSGPTFDPMLGFANGRKPRVLTVSAEEMEAVQLQPWEKNYCGDLHVKVAASITESDFFISFLLSRPRFVTTRTVPGAGGVHTSGTRWIIV